MPVYTLQNVFDQARAILFDIQVAGGEVFTNTLLQPYFNESWRTVWSRLSGASRKVRKQTYILLPPYTTVCDPTNYGVQDINSIVSMEEGDVNSMTGIVSTSATSPIVVTTAAPHGLGTNEHIYIQDVSGTFAPWGDWFVFPLTSTTFSLIGSFTDGVAGAGGLVVTCGVQFQTMNSRIAMPEGIPQTVLIDYLWQDGRLHFRGATTDRQLFIMYYSSGTPITVNTQLIGLDDSIDVVANLTAFSAADANGWENRAKNIYGKVYGGTAQGYDDPGLMDLFIRRLALAEQSDETLRQLPYRPPRSRFGDYIF